MIVGGPGGDFPRADAEFLWGPAGIQSLAAPLGALGGSANGAIVNIYPQWIGVGGGENAESEPAALLSWLVGQGVFRRRAALGHTRQFSVGVCNT
jgi:hypothetical protein